MNLSQPNHTAVLLFTRTAAEEVSQKGLLLPHRAQQEKVLAQQLIDYTQSQVQQAGLPLYTAYSTQQEGDTFGERLANEAEKVFAKGHEHIIIIGNDCLQLTASLLQEAAIKGQEGKTVLGPTHDGGLYLIGLHKNQFDKEKFIGLDWQTEWCYRSFLDYLGKKNAIYTLRTFSDLDSVSQLHSISKQLHQSHDVKQWLIAFFNQTIQNYTVAVTCLFQLFFSYSKPLRAPPAQV